MSQLLDLSASLDEWESDVDSDFDDMGVDALLDATSDIDEDDVGVLSGDEAGEEMAWSEWRRKAGDDIGDVTHSAPSIDLALPEGIAWANVMPCSILCALQ